MWSSSHGKFSRLMGRLCGINPEEIVSLVRQNYFFHSVSALHEVQSQQIVMSALKIWREIFVF